MSPGVVNEHHHLIPRKQTSSIKFQQVGSTQPLSIENKLYCNLTVKDIDTRFLQSAYAFCVTEMLVTVKLTVMKMIRAVREIISIDLACQRKIFHST